METKVKLSANELALVTNSDIILTKNAIIGKVYTLFGQINVLLDAMIQQSGLAQAVPVQPAKIARGENYLGLPWVMLDSIRYFKQDAGIGIRILFWWGHFCSVTLQLNGRYVAQYVPAMQHYFAQQATQDWYINVPSDNAWQHHFEPANYRPLHPALLNGMANQPFCKLAKKIPLEEWDNIEAFVLATCSQMLQLLTRHPNGETNL